MVSRTRALKARLAELQLRPSRELAREAIRLATNMAEAWPRMTLDERRQAWAYSVDEVEVRDGLMLAFRPKVETAPLFAPADPGGPDRSPTRQCLSMELLWKVWMTYWR